MKVPRRWPCLGVALAALSLNSPSFAESQGAALPAKSPNAARRPVIIKKKSSKRYVYVTLTATNSTAAGPGTEMLLDQIDNAVVTGVRLALNRENVDERRFDEVISYRQIDRNSGNNFPQTLYELKLYSTRNLSPVINRARHQFGVKDDLDLSLVKPVIFRSESGQLRVDLELYTGLKEDQEFKLVAVKSAGGCGESDNEVLERIRQSAEMLALEPDSKDPNALSPTPIIAGPSGPVEVGTPITLDGCLSTDPQHDALVWTWSQWNHDGFRVLPMSGYPGRRVRFVPERPGRYTLQLEVRQVVDSDGNTKPGIAIRTIDVVAQPRAIPGPSRVVEQLGKTVTLNGSQSTPLDNELQYRWRQIAGPRVTLISSSPGKAAKDSTECDEAICTFEPTIAGLYTFNLEVMNGSFKNDSDVSILVAPPPVVRLPDRATSLAGLGFVGTIDGGASYDVLDDAPTFRWQIEFDGRNEKEEDQGITLFDQDKTEVSFYGSELGRYDISLLVCARRRLPGQELRACSKGVTTAQVRRSWLALFGTLSAHHNFGPDSNVLSANLGAMVQPFGALYDYPRLSAITLRGTLAMASADLGIDHAGALAWDKKRWGGGNSLELGYWFRRPGPWQLLARAGIYGTFDDLNPMGFIAGMTWTFQIWGRLTGFVEPDYRYVPQYKANTIHQLGVGAGLGLRL